VLKGADEAVVANDEQTQLLFQNVLTNFKVLEGKLAPSWRTRLFGSKTQNEYYDKFSLYADDGELLIEKLVYLKNVQYSVAEFQKQLSRIRIRLRKGTFLHQLTNKPNVAVVHPLYGTTDIKTIVEFAVNLQYLLMEQLKLSAKKYIRA
jgi:hypothetical protein